MSPLSKAEVSLSSQNDVRMSGQSRIVLFNGCTGQTEQTASLNWRSKISNKQNAACFLALSCPSGPAIVGSDAPHPYNPSGNKRGGFAGYPDRRISGTKLSLRSHGLNQKEPQKLAKSYRKTSQIKLSRASKTGMGSKMSTALQELMAYLSNANKQSNSSLPQGMALLFGEGC